MEIFVSIIFPLMFCLVLGIIVYTYARNIKTWNKNNHSPRLTVESKVVAKRHAVTGRTDSANLTGLYSYFVTFEFESGDRLELPVNGNEFGMLVEGDKGKLTFQGTRYIDFKRM